MRCKAPDPRQAWTACLVWQRRRSPGKAPSLRARTKTGPLPTKFLAGASSTGCETLAAKSSRFCRERAWQHLFRASLAQPDELVRFLGMDLDQRGQRLHQRTEVGIAM